MNYIFQKKKDYKNEIANRKKIKMILSAIMRTSKEAQGIPFKHTHKTILSPVHVFATRGRRKIALGMRLRKKKPKELYAK